MTGWIIVGFFTAFGILCAGLVLWGMVLFRCFSGAGGWLLVPPEERQYVGYYRWLQSMGIIRCRIIVSELPDLDRLGEEQQKNSPGDQSPEGE